MVAQPGDRSSSPQEGSAPKPGPGGAVEPGYVGYSAHERPMLIVKGPRFAFWLYHLPLRTQTSEPGTYHCSFLDSSDSCIKWVLGKSELSAGSNRTKVERELCVQPSEAVGTGTPLQATGLPSPLPEASSAQPALSQTTPQNCPPAGRAVVQGKGWMATGFTTQMNAWQTYPSALPKRSPSSS